MTTPTDPSRKSPSIPSPPAKSSATDTQSSSIVPPSKPVTPKTPNQTSATGLGARTIGLTSPGQLSVNRQAQQTQALQASFIHQRDTVNAIRVQQFLLSEIDTLIQQLDGRGGDSTHSPFIVIHVDADGNMENLVPPAQELVAQPEKLAKLNSEAKRQFEKIDAHYRRSETRALQQELERAETTLTGYALKLQAEGIPIPKTPTANSPLSITRMSQEPARYFPAPPSPPCKPNPGEFLFSGSLQPPYYSGEGYPPLASYSSTPTPAKFNTEDEGTITPATSPEPPGPGSHYLAILGYYYPFNNRNHPPMDFDQRAEHALLLRSTSLQDPTAVPDRYGSAHIARKALLFKLLMNLYKQHEYWEATAVRPEIIELIQWGILATNVHKNHILDGKGAESEFAICKNMLIQAEGVTPEVADVVAGIVTGTAYQDSLPAKLLRNVERLEDMRFQDQFDINTLEVTADGEGGCVKVCMSKLVYQWRDLLRQQGELDCPAALVHASGINQPQDGYVSNDDPTARQQINETGAPYTFQNARISTQKEQLKYLEQLRTYE